MNQRAKETAIQDEDYERVRAFLSDDRGAFEELLLKYRHLVFSLCLRMLGNREDADDCAQETFVKVYKALQKFKFEAKFSTWLYRIAVNTCKNKLSSAEYRHRSRFVLVAPLRPEEEPLPGGALRDETNLPEDIYEKRMTRELIMDAIRTLSKDHKTLIVLADLEGYPYETIVQITGLRLGTVKSRLARARHQLRAKLEGVIRV